MNRYERKGHPCKLEKKVVFVSIVTRWKDREEEGTDEIEDAVDQRPGTQIGHIESGIGIVHNVCHQGSDRETKKDDFRNAGNREKSLSDLKVSLHIEFPIRFFKERKDLDGKLVRKSTATATAAVTAFASTRVLTLHIGTFSCHDWIVLDQKSINECKNIKSNDCCLFRLTRN
jgi:hypothetical protein